MARILVEIVSTSLAISSPFALAAVHFIAKTQKCRQSKGMAPQRFHDGVHLGRPLWVKPGNLRAARNVCILQTFSLLQLSADYVDKVGIQTGSGSDAACLVELDLW